MGGAAGGGGGGGDYYVLVCYAYRGSVVNVPAPASKATRCKNKNLSYVSSESQQEPDGVLLDGMPRL